ncbi:MAG: hypothetical protein ACRDZ8_19745 [Acidimicrobiales bacterium]
MSNPSTHEPHPRIRERKKERPVKVADQLPKESAVDRFNTAVAIKVTNAVGTMWCAYAFTVLALISLPSVLKAGSLVGIVSWIAQTFLQLVLLSIIIVGQNVQAAASDKRAEATYEDADAVFHTALEIQNHLGEQDATLSQLLAQMAQLCAAGGPPAIA